MRNAVRNGVTMGRSGKGRTGLATRVAATLATATMTTAVATVFFAGTAGAVSSPGSTNFPRYKEIESNVVFWNQVFTKWTSRQIAFHDVEHLDLVYSVLSVDDIVTRLPAAQQDEAIKARRKAEGERISAMLERIAGGHARTEEERRVLKAIAKIGHEPSYATTLAGQVRSQRGLGDKFCEAAARAEAYRPMMSEILERHGVPEELLALPVVESGYKIGARSSAGAAGIWQFIASTARIFDLTLTDAVDDRRDPRRSTEAAARMLRKTYDSLGSWPLAITSYNHGPGGVARAVKEMGTTHFGVISRHYKGKAFGFASRNYYAEFLAAADAMKRQDELCGPLNVQVYAPDEVVLGASASIQDLARAASVRTEDLAELNPALSDSVARGRVRVPRGYQLNLPRGRADEFAAAFRHVDRSAPKAPTVVAAAGDSRGASTSSASRETTTHRVAKGETLAQIARRYGTTETTLLWMNRLKSSTSLKSGQELKVPSNRAAGEAVATAPERPPFSKSMTTTAGVVAAREAAEAAASAALAAKTAVAAAPAAVIQKDPEAVAAAAPAVGKDGDKAEAAPADEAPVLTAEHKVGRGQTLSQIASMYRMSVDELKTMNGIQDAASLQAGQTLKVHASATEIVSNTTVGRSYRVRSGDTLWSVARAHDTSVDTLKRLNPKLGSAGLKAGQDIKVPSAGAVATAAPARAAASTAKAASAPMKAAPAKAPAKTVSKTTGKTVAKAPAKPAYRSHKVQKGQTLSSIAARYGTSVDAIKRLNGIRDASNVQAGKTLKVPL